MDVKAQTNVYVTECIRHFQSFAGVTLPQPVIIPVPISLASAQQNGYGAWATHKYIPLEDRHYLYIWDSLFKGAEACEYLLFHELTHIWDAERYAKGDKMQYFAIKGFTEYHAAQIDMMKAVRCISIDQPIHFTMEETVTVFPSEESVLSYVRSARDTANSLLSRNDFPKDLEALVTFLGLVFNYLGRLSICTLYSKNYPQYMDELEKLDGIRAFLNPEVFDLMLKLLNGWLSDNTISVLGKGYMVIASGLINKYHLA